MKCAVFLIASLSLFLSAPVLAFHDDPGRTSCLDCHRGLPFEQVPVLFQENVMAVCRSCHPANHITAGVSHPLDVEPTMHIPADMPLDGRGRIDCITCHFYHPEGKSGGKRYDTLLRRQAGRIFCFTCHEKV